MDGNLETGIALAFASVLIGAIGLFWTIKSGLTKVERERLNWLESEYPKRMRDIELKDARILELNNELFSALRRRAGP